MRLRRAWDLPNDSLAGPARPLKQRKLESPHTPRRSRPPGLSRDPPACYQLPAPNSKTYPMLSKLQTPRNWWEEPSEREPLADVLTHHVASVAKELLRRFLGLAEVRGLEDLGDHLRQPRCGEQATHTLGVRPPRSARLRQAPRTRRSAGPRRPGTHGAPGTRSALADPQASWCSPARRQGEKAGARPRRLRSRSSRSSPRGPVRRQAAGHVPDRRGAPVAGAAPAGSPLQPGRELEPVGEELLVARSPC